MLVRDNVEKQLPHAFDSYKYGTTIWSPLCSGLLTGKYNEGIPEGSRFAEDPFLKVFIYDRYMAGGKKEELVKKLNQLAVLAKKLDCSLTQLCLAWVVAWKDCTTTILGCSSVKQFEENIQCLKVVPKLTKEINEEIEKILDNRPPTEFNWKVFAPFAPRR